jgi:hypothetical protein
MKLGLVAQSIENYARLNPRKSLFRVYFQNLVHELGEIENYSDVAALPGQAGACSPR